LFLALAGAGVAASLAVVKSAKPETLVAGSASANGKVSGPRVTGGRASVGVYTLTISGSTFSARTAGGHAWNNTPRYKAGLGSKLSPPTCDTASEVFASNGSATVEVDCFTYDPATGWQPADTAFDFQMVGPSH
jgi:hypothetical protein